MARADDFTRLKYRNSLGIFGFYHDSSLREKRGRDDSFQRLKAYGPRAWDHLNGVGFVKRPSDGWFSLFWRSFNRVAIPPRRVLVNLGFLPYSSLIWSKSNLFLSFLLHLFSRLSRRLPSSGIPSRSGQVAVFSLPIFFFVFIRSFFDYVWRFP